MRSLAERMLNVAPPVLIGHCYRTYEYGKALLRDRAFDDDVLYVASLLHDLGFTEAHDDGVTPFELIGARDAQDALVRAGASKEFAGLVHDAIALHLGVSTADDPRPEVAGVSLGAAVDVLGMRLSDLDPLLVERVLTAYPRDGWPEYAIETLRRQSELKPHSKIAVYCRKYDFLARIMR